MLEPFFEGLEQQNSVDAKYTPNNKLKALSCGNFTIVWAISCKVFYCQMGNSCINILYVYRMLYNLHMITTKPTSLTRHN